MITQVFESLVCYLRAPAARSADEFRDEIEDEIAFHVAERSREFMAEGMSEPEAKTAALRKFGDAPRIASECHKAAVGGLVLWHRLHLMLTAALAVVLTALVLTSHSPNSGRGDFAATLPSGVASLLDNDWTGDIRGQILDDRGQPLDEARVLISVKTWPDQSYFQRAYAVTTDSRGTFTIDNVHPVDEQFEVQVAAVKQGYALVSSYHSAPAGMLKPLVLQLPSASGFILHVESEQGVTLGGVDVLPHGRTDTAGTEHVLYFDSAQSLARRTDFDGCAEFSYFQPGDKANVLLRAASGEWEPHDFIVPKPGEVVTLRIPLKPEHHLKDS